MSSKYASLPDIVSCLSPLALRPGRPALTLARVALQDSAPDVYETPDVPAEVSHEVRTAIGCWTSSISSRPASSATRTRTLSSHAPAPLRRAAAHSLACPRVRTSTANGSTRAMRAGGLERRRWPRTSRVRALFSRRNPADPNPTLACTDQSTNKKFPSRRLPSTNTYSTSARSGDDGPREKETTLERLRRLRSEVEELEQDVRREQAEESEATDAPPSADAKGKRKEVTPAVILQQLKLLRGDLGGVELTVSGTLEAEGEKEAGIPSPTGLAQKANRTSSLLSKLGFASSASASTDGNSPASPRGAVPAPVPGQGQLEKRVSDMERVLGASEADVDEVRLDHPAELE